MNFGFVPFRTTLYYTCRLYTSYFEENGETVHLPNDTVVSMNFWGFGPSVFEYLAKDFDEFVADPNTDVYKRQPALCAQKTPMWYGHV